MSIPSLADPRPQRRSSFGSGSAGLACSVDERPLPRPRPVRTESPVGTWPSSRPRPGKRLDGAPGTVEARGGAGWRKQPSHPRPPHGGRARRQAMRVDAVDAKFPMSAAAVSWTRRSIPTRHSHVRPSVFYPRPRGARPARTVRGRARRIPAPRQGDEQLVLSGTGGEQPGARPAAWAACTMSWPRHRRRGPATIARPAPSTSTGASPRATSSSRVRVGRVTSSRAVQQPGARSSRDQPCQPDPTNCPSRPGPPKV